MIGTQESLLKKKFTSFSRKKFLSLDIEHRHRIACRLLRIIYTSFYSNSSSSVNDQKQYENFITWCEWEKLDQNNPQELANRFHWHLQRSNSYLKEHRLLPSIQTQDKEKGLNPLPIDIYLDKIRSAHNIGSILRTTESFALGTLYFADGMAFTDNKQVQDAAMGTIPWISCKQGVPLKDLKRPIIALETSCEAQSLFGFPLPHSFTVVIGNEEFGCSQETLAIADIILKIPLFGRKNSLNVSNAFAILAAEIALQKRNINI